MDQIVQVTDVGVKYVKYNNIKRQELKSIVLNSLRGKKLRKQEFWALKQVTLTCSTGEIVGIIGNNGAGKSTLCRVLSQILVPDIGEVHVDGLVSALLSLGTGFNDELTGKENIYLNGMMLGFSYKQIREVYDEIVAFADIGEFINQPIKQYSKGMRSRLGFSIASMLEPEILILDETLNAGDEEFKRKASEKMSELMRHAKLVILVSHDLTFIQERCSRVIWLEKGVIKKEGDPTSICEEYKKGVKPKKNKLLDNYSRTDAKTVDIDVVVVSNIGIRFRVGHHDFWALKDLSFSVQEGEILGIIGHNGAGKSTLCKVLSGIIQPDSGSIEIFGRTTEILGFGSGFNKQLSGTDNIYLNGLLLGIPKKKLVELHNEIVEFSGLEDSMDMILKEYSSGMISRLGFSIATSIDPEILILDEALSAGDYAFQEKAATKIQEMMGKAKAVIVVTHNMNFVRNVCTRALWIEQGRLVLDGNPDEVVDAYLGNTERA
jgi:teichoic acid transport system ATP-binding protein